MKKLLEDVHEGLQLPHESCYAALVKGKYTYYHYGCDGQNDRGWGCGYRTLQTMCSWIVNQRQPEDHTDHSGSSRIPSIPEIQQALVKMGDKPQRFVASRDWIGSAEVFMCLDHFYEVPSKVIHVYSGSELHQQRDRIVEHFNTIGSPIMMGGDNDASSKGVLGICSSIDRSYLLILDPHYSSPTCNSIDILQRDGWVSWQPIDSFMDSSFYNLCLPQYITR
ncbi:ufm1-specific protease 1-like [Ornithodoros turicata]|uniref:ufm1-specific protease 1-like n=1 Tax=Ornithodoros turicata TaxID=34597 RepID=UPI0031399CFF